MAIGIQANSTAVGSYIFMTYSTRYKIENTCNYLIQDVKFCN